MALQDGEELTLLAVLTALALAQDKKASEVAFLAGFTVVVSDVLAFLAVILSAEETAETEKKAKEDEEKLAKRLERIEDRLKALAECCQAQGKK